MICEMNETSSRYGTPIEVPKFMGPGSCAQPVTVPEVARETPLRLDISYDHDIFNDIACYRRNYGYVTLAAASQRVIPAGTCPGPLSPINISRRRGMLYGICYHSIPYLLTYPSWIKPGVS